MLPAFLLFRLNLSKFIAFFDSAPSATFSPFFIKLALFLVGTLFEKNKILILSFSIVKIL